jgi:hypothetical protein
MAQTLSWAEPARQYLSLYARTLEERRQRWLMQR